MLTIQSYLTGDFWGSIPHFRPNLWLMTPKGDETREPTQSSMRLELMISSVLGHTIWGFPEMRVPLVIIHFRLGFSLANQPAIGVPPWLWNPALSLYLWYGIQSSSEDVSRQRPMLISWHATNMCCANMLNIYGSPWLLGGCIQVSKM